MKKTFQIYYIITFFVDFGFVEFRGVQWMESGLRMICLKNRSPEDNFVGNGNNFSVDVF